MPLQQEVEPQINGFFDPTPGINAQLLPNPKLKSEDLSGQWCIRKDLRLSASSATTQADAYTQPGRHVDVALVKDF